MRAETTNNEAAWQEENFPSAALPDRRLARRLRRLPDQFSAAPGKPILRVTGGIVSVPTRFSAKDEPQSRTKRPSNSSSKPRPRL
jgi:hypothetical protein